MTVKRVWMAFVLGAAVAACNKDISGTQNVVPPLAGLRFFNAVADTGSMDIRLVDIVAYAPNTVGATFRTGGNPMGIATSFPPPYLPVEAGARHIRAFMTGTTPAVASTIMLDTIYTFVASTNYTAYVYGSARSGHLTALITADSVPTPTAGNIGIRTINLASDTTGLGTTVDAFVILQANTPSGTPTIAGSTYLAKSAYVNVPVGSLKAVVVRGGTTTAVATLNLPAGVAGVAVTPTTQCLNPIAGTTQALTGMTAVILPRSVPGSTAASFAAPGVVYMIDLSPPLTCP